MGDLLDRAEKLLTRGQVDRAAAELVFRGIDELQKVQSKAAIDINNVESVMVAFEVAQLFGRLGSLPSTDVQKLSDAITTVVADTVEQSVQFLRGKDGVWPDISYEWIGHAIKALVKANEQVAIISFNYDVGADVTLHRAGCPPDYGLDNGPQALPGSIPLLKLHGSLSWRNAESGEINPQPLERLVFEPGLPHRERMPFRIYVPGGRVIVPPTWNKSSYYRSISSVWKRAAEELREADNIYVFGYSLPPSDGFFPLLYGLGTVGPTRIKRFWVSDPDERVKGRFENLLGAAVKARFDFWPLPFSEGMERLLERLREEKAIE